MSEENPKNHYSSEAHQQVQRSTTLNRRYVHRPEPMIKKTERESEDTLEVVKISSFAKCQAENLRRRQELADKINQERLAAMRERRLRGYVPESKAVAVELPEDGPVEKSAEIVEKPVDNSVEKYVENPMQTAANERLAQTWEPVAQQKSAQDLKDEAIRKAMRSVATMASEEKKERTKRVARSRKKMRITQKKRVVMAVVSAVAVVAAIGYFVSVNLPDVSVQVTALQSGISNPYPSYVPRGFSMTTSMASENGLSMTFSDGEKSFTLTEEKSTWDSKTLVTNYVERNWRGYDTVKEQGLTIYISGSNAAWVNGGVKYIIEANFGVLTNKQIKNIATSL